MNGSCQVNEILISLSQKCIMATRTIDDVMPILTLEDLDICERVARADPGVIQACKDIGIDNMDEVYFDGWAVGADERYGFDRRLQQGLAYWRSSETDNQYAHPLDFCMVIDTEKEEVLRIDIRRVDGKRVPVPRKSHNFLPEFIKDGYITDRLKDLIKYNGFQVAPAQLEDLLLGHPAVADVTVIGVYSEERATELPRAYVVPAAGYEGDGKLEKTLQEWLNERVSPHKKLRGGVRFVEAIPKSNAGKILRRVLVEEARAEEKGKKKGGSVKARL